MIKQGLYDPRYEHDACGVGYIAHLKGERSHQIVADALTVLENMEHRGATGYESNAGDGAGIMIQIPHRFYADEMRSSKMELLENQYGVGMLFLPKNEGAKSACKQIIAGRAKFYGFTILGFRKIPVDNSWLAPSVAQAEPDMEQIFVNRPDHLSNDDDYERKLYILRCDISKTIRRQLGKKAEAFYSTSFSHRMVVYKGQFISLQLSQYFPELKDERIESAFGLVHSRFATNTFPSWHLAQPFRLLAHNGEINTLQGNLNWFRSNSKAFLSPYFTHEEMQAVLPSTEAQSDSACFDHVAELLMHAGRSLPHVMMMLIPEAWDGNADMPADKKAFYQYHSMLMEPWDGPACMVFTDGKMLGATLDRNGLRPARYVITKDDRVILASEAGVLEIDPELAVEKGCLEPGKMFLVDLVNGGIVSDEKIKGEMISRQPYQQWLDEHSIHIDELPEPRLKFTSLDHEAILKYQKVFRYTAEDINTLIVPMAIDGKEPVGSMGTDVPLAVLSDKPQHFSNYFKQLFAQVTNPPIDPIRERMVMSLAVYVGNNGNMLDEDPSHCHCIGLNQPILSNSELEKIRSVDTGSFQAKTLQTYFKADGKPGSMQKALDRLCRYAEDAIEDGFQVLVLSDRAIDSEHAGIPSVLAVSAVHQHLIRKGLRGSAGLVVEAGDVWETHHFACLIGFGATAINPYLALETIFDLRRLNQLNSDLDEPHLVKNYVKAINDGLLKIFSKMGISTLQSYHGAQIFEILGIKRDVVDRYFTGAVSRIEGLGLDEIAEEVLRKHRTGFKKDSETRQVLETGGIYQWNRTGEGHLFNPKTIHLLQQAARTGDYEIYKEYARLIDEQDEMAFTLRGQFEMVSDRHPVALDEVESVEDILKRFATGAMSFGSISHEAHSTLAIAMNRIGAKSNTGEGGEDDIRMQPMENGDSMRSAIKQVASARFGVTSYYLSHADELQIKMAQGAKPGEGGQLPGHKVDEWIGKVRYSTPGVGLISPPPHHDIYSIEDLKQLIFDLKNANRRARISVKLVSKAGVGTIAAGVAKAHSDVILISGYDGGTGASPLSSIRHAGLPWELGLAEAHQTLVLNKLRNRVVLQADGQIKTARDIAVATLLGAEEWGVSTAALVAGGCIMMRKCHLNTCPVGIATQNPDLRKLFTGEPEHIVNLFHFMAEELREIMAVLGFRTIEEMVGQSQVLKQIQDNKHWKRRHIDLKPMLFHAQSELPVFHTEDQNHELENALDWKLIEATRDAVEHKTAVQADFTIKNLDRATGTILSNEITLRHGKDALAPASIQLRFKGSAGQSFGAFTVQGLRLELEGEANDYVGKGLSGAEIAIYPDRRVDLPMEKNMLVGNAVLYGATSGELFVRGRAGVRFAVRNSGASAVIEGVGDHGCEYMTGGHVVVLGPTGRNFAAGMSGGIAWVYDPHGRFRQNCNMELVDLDAVDEEDEHTLLGMIEKHQRLTKSKIADEILQDFAQAKEHFIKVFPKEYKLRLAERKMELSNANGNG
ncbi:MAG: glutamate synthase large subunit [Mucilaginibacter polytrichastri]|nr:glutamate synthase large subunit [Mucilaginibacter polytrichastri]